MSDHHTASDQQPGAEPAQAAEAFTPAVDVALRGVVLELEKHAQTQGWDVAPKMYALVETTELLSNEPGLRDVLGVDPSVDLTGSLTPIEQDDLSDAEQLEAVLAQVAWPPQVNGAAVCVERLVLPPTVTDLPEDPAQAQAFAQAHPDRHEVRMVVGATRAGASYCALRLREHQEDAAVIEGTDLVPALLELLRHTLREEPQTSQSDGPGGPDEGTNPHQEA